jgi:pSer/pThr/pTyr-binding forkhead associated (FHA) protein
MDMATRSVRRRELSLDEGDNILGRVHEAALWVDHPSVSRRHAVIRIDDGRAWLEDCGSKHGTFVGGERIAAPRPLSDGDTICLGQATLVFRVFEPATTDETGTENG